jgi:hypothetical protein
MSLAAALLLLFFRLSVAGISPLLAGDSPAAPGWKKARLHVLASESLFVSVNEGDAVASMTLWAQQIGKLRGFQFESRMELARSAGQFRQQLKDRAVDLLVLDTPDYLSLADSGLIEAVVAGTNRGQLAAFPYLLLTNDPAGATPLTGLRGRRIAVASRTKSNMGMVWLETELAQNRLGRAATFFASVEASYRASACVLPLFFGKIDACVVDAGNLESLQELNPQLGRLRVAARSAPLLEGLIAMPVQPHPYRDELIDSLLNLHRSPAGEQLGVVFRTGPLARAGREQFESVRLLVGRYRRIVEKSADLRASSAAGFPESAGKERN